jgi:hypothetical protein
LYTFKKLIKELEVSTEQVKVVFPPSVRRNNGSSSSGTFLGYGNLAKEIGGFPCKGDVKNNNTEIRSGNAPTQYDSYWGRH